MQGVIQQPQAGDPFQDITDSDAEDVGPEEMLLDRGDDISDE